MRISIQNTQKYSGQKKKYLLPSISDFMLLKNRSMLVISGTFDIYSF